MCHRQQRIASRNRTRRTLRRGLAFVRRVALVSLCYVARDTNAVCRSLNDRVPHFFFDLRLLTGSGQNEPLRGVDMPGTGPMARFAADHQEILVGAGNIAARFAKTSDMARQARRIVLILLRDICKRLSMFRFRPGIRLRTMANKALIRPHIGLLHNRRRGFFR